MDTSFPPTRYRLVTKKGVEDCAREAWTSSSAATHDPILAKGKVNSSG